MPKHPQPSPAHLFGDSAWILQTLVLLLTDAVVRNAPAAGIELAIELEKLTLERLPTPGIQRGIADLKAHVTALLSPDDGVLPS